MKKKIFKVTVTRIGYSHQEIKVKANNVGEAKDIAVDNAPDYEFKEHLSTYGVLSCKEVKPTKKKKASPKSKPYSSYFKD